jgi:hypothetical protein
MWTQGSTIVFACALALACGTPKVIQVNAIKAPALSEDALLDASIVVFDPGVTPGETPPEQVNPQIRSAEASYFPYLLRTTLEETRQWGLVRVVPTPSSGNELTIEGEILESNGLVLRLKIEAYDATGREWLAKKYETGLDAAAYQAAKEGGYDPYQPLFNLIANDLMRARNELSAREVARVRDVAQMRFAADLSPDPFASYLEQRRGGEWQLTRLPAHGDPSMQRVLEIRDRDAMFVDSVNAHYAYFAQEMDKRGYRDLREAAMVEELAYREVKRQANLRKISGIALVLAGAAVAVAGGNEATAILGTATAAAGVEVARGGFQMSGEAEIHREAIEELAASFDSEVTPVVIEMQGDTVRLTGTATAQYEEWRRLLAALYRAETELQAVGPPVAASPTEIPDEQPAPAE